MRKLLILTSLCYLAIGAPPALAQNQVELILDGFAYELNSNVTFNLSNKTITITDSGATNCLQPDQSIPLNNAGNFTLLTNNQAIGISQIRYQVDGKLLYLTSETSNLVCENGIYVDEIFAQGFEELIFADGFD